jgi:excisionase family DNA binding protein
VIGLRRLRGEPVDRLSRSDLLDKATDYQASAAPTGEFAMANPISTKTGKVVPESRRWSVREVAEFLGVSVKSVRRWSEAGKMPRGRRLAGRVLRWDPEAVRRWFDKQPYA